MLTEKQLKNWLVKMRQAKRGTNGCTFYDELDEMAAEIGLPYLFDKQLTTTIAVPPVVPQESGDKKLLERLTQIENLLRETRDEQHSFRVEFRASHEYYSKLKAHQVAKMLNVTADHVRRLDRRQRNNFPKSRLDESEHRYWLLGEMRSYLGSRNGK